MIHAHIHLFNKYLWVPAGQALLFFILFFFLRCLPKFIFSLFLATDHPMQILSSLIRDQTHAPVMELQIINHQMTKEVLTDAVKCSVVEVVNKTVSASMDSITLIGKSTGSGSGVDREREELKEIKRRGGPREAGS